MSGKVQFTVYVNPLVAAELERIRGSASKSVVVEAMMMECMNLPEEIMAQGKRHC